MGNNDGRITENMHYGNFIDSINNLRKSHRQTYKPGQQNLAVTYDEYKFFPKKSNSKNPIIAEIGYEDSQCNPEIKVYAKIKSGIFTYSSKIYTEDRSVKPFNEVIKKFDCIETSTQYAIDGSNGCPKDGIVQAGEIQNKSPYFCFE